MKMNPKPIIFTLDEAAFRQALRGITAANIRWGPKVFNCRLTDKRLKIESPLGMTTIPAESPKSVSFQITRYEFQRASRAYKKNTICDGTPCKIYRVDKTLWLPFSIHPLIRIK